MMFNKGKNGWTIDFSGEKPPTPLLDTINYPIHMKNLSVQVSSSLVLSSRMSLVITIPPLTKKDLLYRTWSSSQQS